MPRTESRRRPWLGVVGRVIGLTVLLTLLSLAVALLLSILGTIVYSRVEHVAPNLMFAYKHIAFPFALGAGAIVLIVILVVEIRNYRQSKVLAAMERTMTVGR